MREAYAMFSSEVVDITKVKIQCCMFTYYTMTIVALYVDVTTASSMKSLHSSSDICSQITAATAFTTNISSCHRTPPRSPGGAKGPQQGAQRAP